MNRIFSTAFVSLFLTFQSCSITSFGQNIEVSSSVKRLFEQVDSVVINKMNQYNIPGLSIGIVRNDSIVYTKGYGVRNIENNALVTENSIFHTASTSKLFTAVAIMKLKEQKALTLDDKLVDILPELTYSDKRVENITIQHLLNHTSGLPDISNYHWNKGNQSENSLREYVLGLNLKLESEPSTQYQYSNLGYDVLGYVIEKVTGSTFDDYLKENILNPSEMHTSDFRYFKIPDSLSVCSEIKCTE